MTSEDFSDKYPEDNSNGYLNDNLYHLNLSLRDFLPFGFMTRNGTMDLFEGFKQTVCVVLMVFLSLR
ncbi:hypothetical protein SNE40_011587 [Patella caerulea]|uniref:Uncharacterized protein n=1 Tax=Patella caerulea TaxID=87958 RepID=A0AAN8JKG1_PATCE